MNTRIEKDLIGKLEINDKHFYGIHTQRAINNFKISKAQICDFPIFIKAMILTKKACALANKDAGCLSQVKCHMILASCDEILNNFDHYLVEFPTDIFQGGAGTSVNMNTNEVIANVALMLNGHKKGDYEILHPNDDVNKSQSTNDVYPTGLRVALYFYIENLLTKISTLIESLEKKGEEFKAVIKMGRTQLQDAIPMSLGEEFLGWATNQKEEIKNLKQVRTLILELNLGATAIGTGVNAPKDFAKLAICHLNKLTNVNFTSAENLIEATSDCGDYVMISGALKRTSVKLSKICNDLRLLSSGPQCGFNEINLPKMQAGSSIMPTKVNPVIPEVVNQVCYKIIGNDMTVTLAAEAGQLQLNVMEPVMAQALFESFEFLSNACQTLADKCIDGITANKEYTKKMVLESVSIITYLNPHIGHDMGSLIGKEALETGKSIRDLVLEKKLLSKEKLDQILDLQNLINPHLIME